MRAKSTLVPCLALSMTLLFALGAYVAVAARGLDTGSPGTEAGLESSIFRVNADAPGPSHDGQSWDTAFLRLHDALVAATSGDEIWVAQGIYTPTDGLGPLTGFGLGSGEALYGGFDGTETERDQRDWDANVTVLSGDLGGDDITDAAGIVTDSTGIVGSNALHVVRCDGCNETTVLDGFFVTAGSASDPGVLGGTDGGGIYLWDSNPTLRNLVLRGNIAEHPGELPGLASHGGGLSSLWSEPVLRNVFFAGNRADYGGGAYFWSSMPAPFSSSSYATEVSFRLDQKPHGAMPGDTNGGPDLYNVVFKENVGVYGGGAFFLENKSPVVNGVFEGNEAKYGSGLHGLRSYLTLVNLRVVGNTQPLGQYNLLSGAVGSEESDMLLANSTLAGNASGGLLIFDGSTANLSNTVLWDNGVDIYVEQGSTVDVLSSLIPSGCPSIANCGLVLVGDPRFVREPDSGDGTWLTLDDNDYGDLRLLPSSPAINSGHGGAVPLDILDQDDDGNTSEPLPYDLDGNPRQVGTVDMGAYEAPPPIIIGVAASFGGADLANQYGWQQRNSVRLAADQTNEAGGIDIDGRHYGVDLRVRDSACDPTQAVTAAHQLLDAGSVAIVGHTCSLAAHAGAPIYNSAGVAMITPSSTDPTLTQQGYTTTFRTTGHIGTGCAVMAKHFYGSGLLRTAILRRDDVWSDAGVRNYARVYEAQGGTITSRRHVTTSDDIDQALTAIQTENVDLILVTDPFGRLAGEVSRAAFGKGMAQPIASLLPWDEYIEEYAGPEAAEGDYAPDDEKRPVDMPGYVPFEAAYLAAGFPTEPAPGGFSPNAYDAAMIIIDAIGRAGVVSDTLAIRDAIAATTDYAGVVGTYERFDENGDVVPQWSRIDVVLEGEWVPAWLPGEFYPDLGGIFDLDDALGTETTIEIPPEPESMLLGGAGSLQTANANSLRTSYAILLTTTLGADSALVMMSGHGLHLEANRPLATAVTLTVAYDDDDVDGMREDTLGLYAWGGSQWFDAQSCGGYVRDTDNNVLQAVICELGDYAILGKNQWVVQLPLVLRNVP